MWSNCQKDRSWNASLTVKASHGRVFTNEHPGTRHMSSPNAILLCAPDTCRLYSHSQAWSEPFCASGPLHIPLLEEPRVTLHAVDSHPVLRSLLEHPFHREDHRVLMPTPCHQAPHLLPFSSSTYHNMIHILLSCMASWNCSPLLAVDFSCVSYVHTCTPALNKSE